MSILLDKQLYKPKSTVICVSPMHEFYLNQHAIFEQFGKLRFVGIDRRMDNGVVIGFIEFEDNSVSDELISKGYVEIEDNRCEVKSYEEYKRESNQVSATVLKLDGVMGALLQPPKQDSCKHILNVLNDDCLREIFKKLHFSTLMSVVNVCMRFHRVAKEAFSSKYKSKKIRIYDLAWNRKPTKSQINNFLSEFGSSISSVSLVGRSESVRSKKYEDTHLHLKMISKYCNGLKELDFCSYHVPESTLYEMCTLFERLRTLRIWNVNSRSFFDIISGCSNLEVLDVYFYGDMGSLIPSNSTLPKIVEATFFWDIHDNDNFDLGAMHKFLELNSKLKVLRVMKACDLVTKVGALSELKEFDIHVCHTFLPSSVATLSSPNIQIENLKVDVSCSFFYGSDKLNYIPTFRYITEFRMRNSCNTLTLDEIIYLMKHLPNLKTFHIYYKFYNKNETLMTIKSILQNAPQLSKLAFERCNLFTNLDKPPNDSFPIDDVEYYEILKSVEDRASGIKLTIQFYFYKILHDEYVGNSQSIYILDMVPKCLTIEQRVDPRRYYYYYYYYKALQNSIV